MKLRVIFHMPLFLMPGKCKLRPESLEIFTYYLMSINFVHTTVLTLELLLPVFSKNHSLFNSRKSDRPDS